MGSSDKHKLQILLLATVVASLSAQIAREQSSDMGNARAPISSGSFARSVFLKAGDAVKGIGAPRTRRFIDSLHQQQPLVHVDGGGFMQHLRRAKRAPCMGGGGSGGGAGGDGAAAEEVARYMAQRRRNSAQQRKRRRSTNKNSVGGRTRKAVSRRRRQAEDADAVGSEIQRKAKEVGERIQGAVKSAMEAMSDFAQQLKQSFNN